MIPEDFKGIGQYLRESRESLGVSLADASGLLHIRSKYLRGLENGDLSDMPGKSYIRGYIRNYAQYLGLDEAQVLEAYGLLLGPPKAQELFVPEQTLQQNLPGRKLVWLSFLALIALYACWYFGFHNSARLSQLVPELPASFARLLEKPLPAALDKSWTECLVGDRSGCYLNAQAKAAFPARSPLYDINDSDTIPSEP